MKSDLTRILSASLVAFLLAPTSAQADIPPLKGALKIINGTSELKKLDKLPEIFKSVEGVLSGAPVVFSFKSAMDVPYENLATGIEIGVFENLEGFDFKNPGAVQAQTALLDGIVVLEDSGKKFAISKGDKIIWDPSLNSFPIIMNQTQFEKFYTPLSGSTNLYTPRNPREPSATDNFSVKLITKDWTPEPTPYQKNPPTYKAGDFLVSYHHPQAYQLMSQKDFLTFFHKPQATQQIFRTMGAQEALTFLGIPTGEPAYYVKKATLQARPAQEGQKIITVLQDGTVETVNTAKEGDWIVTNPGGEEYIISGENFAKKYVAAPELGEGWYKPSGTPQLFIEIQKDLTITTSWGETQFLRAGAYLNITKPGDVYGVAAQEFKDTYKPAE